MRISDWSSDVCSSDLSRSWNAVGGFMRKQSFIAIADAIAVFGSSVTAAQTMTSGYGARSDPFHGKKAKHSGVDIAARTRSEERRVGKEGVSSCTCRWLQSH